jgi:hydrogenase expression/formation protein HypE
MKSVTVTMGHGSGGRLTKELVEEVFLSAFRNPELEELSDSAVLDSESGRIALTTDSYVVKPAFFPGGDLGKLAVCGTVNDLSVVGARPLYITCGFIIEEGYSIESLRKIVDSMRCAATDSGVLIVAGDTKVVDKNSCDGVFINTSGVGVIPDGLTLGKERVMPGDAVLLSGTVGDHGMAVLMEREEFAFEGRIESDCAPLNGLVQDILSTGADVKFMRDVTRGGLATILNELSSNSDFGVLVEENLVPVREEVRALCEILGMDSLYVPNEGKVVLVCSESDRGRVLDVMKNHPLGREAGWVGQIVAEHAGVVSARTQIGSQRILDMLVDDQLPRIC